MNDARPPLPSPTEQPQYSARERWLSALFFYGLPFLLLGACVMFIATGWAAAVLPIFMFMVLFVSFLIFVRLRGAALMNWDDDRIVLQSRHGTERVPWDDVEWYCKLWLTSTLAGDKAWIATSMRYRTGDGRSVRVFLTVWGRPRNEAFGSLFPNKYETVFDVRIPSKNRAVAQP